MDLITPYGTLKLIPGRLAGGDAERAVNLE
jgi:hypothetical protein